MTLEELQNLIDKDLKINDTELDLESLKTFNYTTNIQSIITNIKIF